MRILAIDPGTHKAGIVVVDIMGAQYALHHRAIVSRDALKDTLQTLLAIYQPDRLLIGKGTGSRTLVPILRAQFPYLQWELVEERNTTLQARELYFRHHPPRGWRRWLPKGLRLPPEPYDDYAALALVLQTVTPEDD